MRYIHGDARHISLQQLGGEPFRGFIVDPPWDFEVWNPESGGEKGPGYDLMTLDDILAMPVAHLAAADSVLFLWSTNPFMPQALRVMESWGFSYRTKFPWIKTTTRNQKLDYGTGYWVRGVSEDILIGTRGSVKAPRQENYLGLIGPNIEHSRKPQDIHAMAEATTPGPYLELFARYSRPGWVCFGNDNRGVYLPDPLPTASPSWLTG